MAKKHAAVIQSVVEQPVVEQPVVEATPVVEVKPKKIVLTPLEQANARYEKSSKDLRKLEKALQRHAKELQMSEIEVKLFTKEMRKILVIARSHAKKIETFNLRFDAIEETLYCIYTGVKQNQFLYAYDGTKPGEKEE